MDLNIEKYNTWISEKDKKYIIFSYKIFIKYLKEKNLFNEYVKKFNIKLKMDYIDIYSSSASKEIRNKTIDNIIDFLIVRYIFIGKDVFRNIFDRTLVYTPNSDRIDWNLENYKWGKFFNEINNNLIIKKYLLF